MLITAIIVLVRHAFCPCLWVLYSSYPAGQQLCMSSLGVQELLDTST